MPGFRILGSSRILSPVRNWPSDLAQLNELPNFLKPGTAFFRLTWHAFGAERWRAPRDPEDRVWITAKPGRSDLGTEGHQPIQGCEAVKGGTVFRHRCRLLGHGHAVPVSQPTPT